jgi:hypothetical protein
MKVSRLLVLLGLAAAGGAADTMFYTNAPKDIVAQVADLSTVARVRFFMSADQGKTWTLLKEIAVAPDAKVPPRLEFRPQSDGSYLVATCAVYKKGNPEPDPKPGAIPANALPLTVDTFKPTVGTLTAALEKAEAEKALVSVAWAASDAHLGDQPVTIDASSDGGATWPLSFPEPAQGSAKITVSIARGTHSVLIRASAKDLAGNVGVSDAQTVVLPPPPDPELELKKAVSSLPTVAEVEPKAKTDATGSDQHQIDAATEPAKQPASAEIPPATASADPSKPDIIAPHAAEDALADPADGGEIVGSGFEQVEVPTKSGNERFSSKQGAKATEATDEEPATEPAAAAPFLPNPAAEVVLQRARDQAKAGDTKGALATYRRLHSSGQAVTAIAEELALLGQLGQQRTIVDTVDSLPPEYIGDAARLSQSRALVALGEHQAALKALSRIHSGAPEAREAMWLIARCFQSLGREGEAKRVLTTLAKGDDEWAQRAKAAAH